MGVESLGVEYLVAAARRAGHEADLLFDPSVFGGHLMWDVPALAAIFSLKKKIIRRTLEEKPDVAAFSCVSAIYHWSLSIAREIRENDPDIKILFGGVHPTAMPDIVIAEDAVDAIILGEADISLPLLLDCWPDGINRDAPGVWWKENGQVIKNELPETVKDLDTLPFPAKDVYFSKAPAFEINYSVIAARGCPNNCTYCYKGIWTVGNTGGPGVRRRSIDNVIEELEPVARRGHAKMIVFRDDIFTLKKKWLAEFTEKYPVKVGIPYFCNTYPLALDSERADMLKESGCVYTTVGVQSADEDQRKNILNRRYKNESVIKTMSLLKERNITVSIDHIIGLPGDTDEILRDAADFYCKLKPDRLLTYWLTYFPGTGIIEKGLECGHLTAEDVEKINAGYVNCLYGGNDRRRKKPSLRKFIVLFSLIPLFGASISKMLARENVFRFIPTSTFFTNIAIALNAVFKRDPFFLYNIKYLFSRKKTP